MQIEQVLKRFENLVPKTLVYRLNNGASLAEVRAAEQRLEVEFPEQVARFWTAINGLVVQDPRFEILSLSNLVSDGRLIVFAICDGDVRLAFDTRNRNAANQWSIVCVKTGYEITYTMASFWSAHMWTWIVKRRPIWFDAHPRVITGP